MNRLPRFVNKLVLLLVLAGGFAQAQSIHINDAGTLREIQEVWINDAGTLRQIQTGWINDAGTLRQIYAALSINLTGASLSTSVGTTPSTASLIVQQDGTLDRNYNSTGNVQIATATDWHIPNAGAPSDYQVRYVSITGHTANFTSSLTQNIWSALSGGAPFFTVTDTQNGPNPKSVTFTLEIRKGTGSTIDTGSYTLSADFDNL